MIFRMARTAAAELTEALDIVDRNGHRHAEMAGCGLLHGIHRQGAYRVDTKIIDRAPLGDVRALCTASVLMHVFLPRCVNHRSIALA